MNKNNLKKTAIIIGLMAAMTASICGCKKSNSDKKDDKTTSEVTEATTESTTEEAKTDDTKEATEAKAQADDTVYFGRGVYEVTTGGELFSYYCFYDESNGTALNPDLGTGMGFTCEQSDGKIVFHFGGISNSDVMNISVNGPEITGKYEDSDKTYLFQSMDSDPESFRDNFYAQYDENKKDDNNSVTSGYEGTYVESVAGRGMMDIRKESDNSYLITVNWSASYNTVANWTMHGTFDDNGVLNYTDCTKLITVYDESGNPTTDENGNQTPVIEYENGKGTLTFSFGEITWDDQNEHIADGCTFVMQ